MTSANPQGTSRPDPRKKGAPVFCVGWRAFVNWPLRGPRSPGPLPLTDLDGNPLSNDLADGQPVEIVSWRPRAREGVLYQIRRLADGTEWWIGAKYLRRQAVAEAVGGAGAARG
jgi:hypothetical protein